MDWQGKPVLGPAARIMGVLLWGVQWEENRRTGAGENKAPGSCGMLGMPQLPSHEDGGTHQLSVERVQGEPESHSAALALGDRLHPVGVLAARREADHPPTLGLDGGLQGNSTAGLARLHTLPVPGLGTHWASLCIAPGPAELLWETCAALGMAGKMCGGNTKV